MKTCYLVSSVHWEDLGNELGILSASTLLYSISSRLTWGNTSHCGIWRSNCSATTAWNSNLRSSLTDIRSLSSIVWKREIVTKKKGKGKLTSSHVRVSINQNQNPFSPVSKWREPFKQPWGGWKAETPSPSPPWKIRFSSQTANALKTRNMAPITKALSWCKKKLSILRRGF